MDALLGSRSGSFGMGAGVGDLFRFLELDRRRRTAVPMGDALVLSDPEEERSLGALVPERGESLPQGETDLLHEVLALGAVGLVRGGDAPHRGAVCGEDPI